MAFFDFLKRGEKNTDTLLMRNPPSSPAIKEIVREYNRSIMGASSDVTSVTTTNEYSNGRYLFSISYDGEKNTGELGPIINYQNDYAALRARSWQLFYESEIAQTIAKRNVIWKISRGLKLEAQPNEIVLKSEGYPQPNKKIATTENDDLIEYRWENFATSKRASYTGLKTLHSLAKEAFKNSIVGGDVLVVLRYVKKQLTVQLIDGSNVATPWGELGQNTTLDIEAGDRTINGIVMNKKGEHIAYYVRTGILSFERIEAVGKRTGMRTAFMIYGLQYRIDNNRGMPLLSVVMETVKKIERYKEATVGSAEEAAKIAFSIEHQPYSTGENPFIDQLAKAMNPASPLDLPIDVNGKELANTVAATTDKRAVNMPPGATLKTLEHSAENHFKDFYTINAQVICAAVGIPPEVAFMKYDSNFSASRAALKDWEHSIMVDRDDFAYQFYQPIYNFWLWTEILTNKINLNGYLRAIMESNYVAIDAFNQARWKGPTVPHIDPLKEVNAVRAMLGIQGESIPLTTVENACDMLNTGDSDENMRQFADELKEAKNNGVYLPPTQGGAPQQMKVVE